MYTWFIYQFGSLLNLGICKENLSMAKAKTPRNAPTRNPVLTMPEAASSPEIKMPPASETDVNTEIRRRAYELYQERGGEPGHEDEDWLLAEREVLARYNHQRSA